MATFRDLLASAKAEITEVTTDVAAQHAADGHIWLDVREPDEYAEGAIEGAIHIPRGHLEAQIEARIPDKSTPGRRLLRRWGAVGVRRAHPRRAWLLDGRVDGWRLRPLEGRGPPVAPAGLALR